MSNEWVAYIRKYECGEVEGGERLASLLLACWRRIWLEVGMIREIAGIWLLGLMALGGCATAPKGNEAGTSAAPAGARANVPAVRRDGDVPVPASCSAQVNEKLAGLISAGQSSAVDNVMVCGITVSASRTQHGRAHGDHEIFPLRVTMPGGDVRLVEVVSNDE